MFEQGGLLADSIGTLIGVGAGRGMAFMFVVLGFIVLGIALVCWLNPSVRFLEDQLPDHELDHKG